MSEQERIDLERDAARYRWLRDTYVFDTQLASLAWAAFMGNGDERRDPHDIDAAIDAAIQKEQANDD